MPRLVRDGSEAPSHLDIERYETIFPGCVQTVHNVEFRAAPRRVRGKFESYAVWPMPAAAGAEALLILRPAVWTCANYPAPRTSAARTSAPNFVRTKHFRCRR